jgi:uncharacterized membrane protein
VSHEAAQLLLGESPSMAEAIRSEAAEKASASAPKPMRLLKHLQGFARWLRPARPLFIGLGVLSFLIAAFLVLVGDPQSGDSLLLGVVVGLLWCLCALLLIDTFENVPPPASAEQRSLARLKRRIVRLWYALLALAFLGLSVAALLVSKRILGEAFG